MRNAVRTPWQWLGTLGLALLSALPCLAVDPGVYQGIWRTHGIEPQVTLMIGQDPQQLQVVIGQYMLAEAEVSYLYAQSAVYPFLFVHASEEAGSADAEYVQYDHALYLIIGAVEPEIGRAYGMLRGFYEFSRVKNDHHGTVESVSYPLELMREP